jgi:hypothetical protein
MLATFMPYLDNNIVNVALPTIQQDLDLTTAGLEWVVSGYIPVFASLMLAGGRLADVYGRRRLFLAGIAVFTWSRCSPGFPPTARSSSSLTHSQKERMSKNDDGNGWRNDRDDDRCLGVLPGPAHLGGAVHRLAGPGPAPACHRLPEWELT